MNIIYDIQKLTLTDYPGKTACIVFTSGCNFDCSYCQNSSLIKYRAGNLSEEEFLKFLEQRKGLLDGVVLSGGEPTMWTFEPILNEIKNMGYSIKLDTNGSSPIYIYELINKNLIDYVAMDIKGPANKYPLITGRNLTLENIFQSIDIIIQSDIDYEFRTTVIDNFHEPEDFYITGMYIRHAKKYYLQKFEMSDNVRDKTLRSPSDEKMEQCLKYARSVVENAQIRGQ